MGRGTKGYSVPFKQCGLRGEGGGGKCYIFTSSTHITYKDTKGVLQHLEHTFSPPDVPYAIQTHYGTDYGIWTHLTKYAVVYNSCDSLLKVYFPIRIAPDTAPMEGD